MEKRTIIALVGARGGLLGNALLWVCRRGFGGLLGLCLLGLAVPACKQKKADQSPPQIVFLVSPQERDQLQRSLLDALLANGRLRCPRPVLRSTAHPGQADGLNRSLVEPSGATARCLAYVEKHWADFRRAFFREPRQLQGGVAGRALPEARPLILSTPEPGLVSRGGTPEPAIVMELTRRCAGIAPLVERVVQRAEVCAPYLPGRRRAPKLGSVLQAHLALVALARSRFRTSPREAAWLLLHALRWGQDLCRGGPAWIWPLVTRLGGMDVVATLRRVLATDRLSIAALGELRIALGRLLASEPALSAHIQGERQASELERYLIPMMPQEWIPPGGRPLSAGTGDQRKGKRKRRGGRAFSGSIRQDLLVAWIASGRYARRLLGACRDGVSGWQCLGAVRNVEQHVVTRRGQLRERWQEFSRRAAKLREGFDRLAAREAAVELVEGVNAPDTSGYLLQAAQRGFYLAAVRLHVEVLLAARHKGWPSLATVASWSEATRDPFARGQSPLRLNVQGTGFEVRPAVSLTARPGGAPVRYVIPGPATVSPSRPKRGKSGRGASGAQPAPRPRTR